ncbi:MAG: hypothetical protein M3163_03350 [Actinomycetota bacterium]|nr:hypothetical protein [Actinomycetota bacterium]
MCSGRHLADLDVAVQVSLDRVEATENDELRAPGNHARMLQAIPRLVGMGIRVRIGTTLDPGAEVSEDEQARLCALHRGLGGERRRPRGAAGGAPGPGRGR